MLLFDFHDFDSDAFFFDESDRQVFVAYGRAEDHLLAFQLFLQRRNGVGNVSLFLYQFGQTAAFLEFQEFDAIRTFAIVCQPILSGPSLNIRPFYLFCRYDTDMIKCSHD